MDTLTLDLPMMFGDHHVIEIRRILLEMSGIENVYASSSFQVVEVTYDPAQLGEDEIKSKLDEAGYLGDLETPVETGESPITQGADYFRHTTAYAQVGRVVGFEQRIGYSGRPLWPCPGMGVAKGMDEG